MSGKSVSKASGGSDDTGDRSSEAEMSGTETEDEKLDSSIGSLEEVPESISEEPERMEKEENFLEVKEEEPEQVEEGDDSKNDSKTDESLLCNESVDDVDNDDDQESTSDNDRKNVYTDQSSNDKKLEREISCEVEISQVLMFKAFFFFVTDLPPFKIC